MEGCVREYGVYLDIDKVALALRNGVITKCGQECVANDAWEIAQSMVDGAVCGTKSTELRDNCPECEEAWASNSALTEDIDRAMKHLRLALKSQSWAEVAVGLKFLEELV
jgi:hypothetical protein